MYKGKAEMLKKEKKKKALADRYLVHVLNMKLCAKVIQCVNAISKLTSIVIKTDAYGSLLMLVYCMYRLTNDQIIAVVAVHWWSCVD